MKRPPLKKRHLNLALTEVEPPEIVVGGASVLAAEKVHESLRLNRGVAVQFQGTAALSLAHSGPEFTLCARKGGTVAGGNSGSRLTISTSPKKLLLKLYH